MKKIDEKWEVQNGSLCPEIHIAGDTEGFQVIADIVTEFTGEEAAEDYANFIVKACNSHNGLVTQAKHLLEHLSKKDKKWEYNIFVKALQHEIDIIKE